MNKLAGIVLFTIIFAIGSATSAHASLFDWITGAKTSSALTPTSNESWSFDTLYQNIQGFSIDSPDTNITPATAVSATAVRSVAKNTPKTQTRTMIVEATGYSSTVSQTDDSPFITAKGTYVRDGIIAANFLPFGTAIKIPAVYGDKIFVVEDRMNKRYTNRIDVWFPETSLALKFGLKKITIEIVS